VDKKFKDEEIRKRNDICVEKGRKRTDNSLKILIL